VALATIATTLTQAHPLKPDTTEEAKHVIIKSLESEKPPSFPDRTKYVEIAREQDRLRELSRLREEEAKKAVTAQSSQVVPPPVVVSGDDAFARLRLCEAGGNYSTNTGNGFYGAYQYDLGTWNNYGGFKYPHEAPPAVQDAKARETQAARGWSPWPACSRKLGLR
jgi:hypothetical protein